MSDKNRKISFNRGVPATRSLPAEKVGEVTSKVLAKDGSSLLQYGDSRGFTLLRKKLAEDYEGASRENVMVANGSLQLLDMITRITVEPGETVLVESPTYDRAITIFERAGAQVVGVGLTEDGIDLDELSKVFEKFEPKLFYVIADFQNPTGITTSSYKRERMVELAEDHGTLIVEDSPYRKLRYRGEEVPTIRSFDHATVAQISSFSKLISPGMRVGWLVGKSDLVEQVARYAEDTYITPNLLSQGIVNQLLRNGWVDENLNELISLYRPRLEATLASLEEYFPEADWIEADGGFFVGLWLPKPEKLDRFSREAEKEGLVLSSSEGFFTNPDTEGFLRLPFPALTPSTIEEGVKRIAKVWKQL